MQSDRWTKGQFRTSEQFLSNIKKGEIMIYETIERQTETKNSRTIRTNHTAELRRKQAEKESAKKHKKLMFNIIKGIPKILLLILCLPFFLIFVVLDNIRLWFLDHFKKDDDIWW